MAEGDTIPYGLHDVKLYPLANEVAGTPVDLPNSQTFSFAESESFTELRGDDALVALHGQGPQVAWELAAGGISLAAVQTMFGGTLITTGTAPDKITTFSKKGNDVRPYFQVQGQAISDSGGDFHVKLYRCRASGDLKGDMKDGAFWITDAKGQAIGQVSDQALYDFIVNDVTAVPLT